MKLIKVLIVDDERAARQEIRRALFDYPQLQLIGEAPNADEALELIYKEKPDLLILDIRMPERSGFDLLESLKHAPEVVFLTAFDQYAIKAFEFNALDYLLKPVRSERFAKAMEKVIKTFETGIRSQQRIFVKEGEKCFFLPVSKIYLAESLDNYVKLFFDNERIMIKSSLNQLEEKLGAANFFRVNRSQLIGLDFVGAIDQISSIKIHLNLTTGHRVELSERQTLKFKQRNSLK